MIRANFAIKQFPYGLQNNHNPFKEAVAEKDPNLKLMFISELEEIDLRAFSLADYNYAKPSFEDPAVIVTSSGSTGLPKLIEKAISELSPVQQIYGMGEGFICATAGQ